MSELVYGFTPAPAAASRSRLAETLRTDLNRLQTETVTGQAEDPANALDGATAAGRARAQRLDRINAWQEAAEFGEMRARAQQDTLGVVRDTAQSLTDSLRTAASVATAGARTLAIDEARAALEGMLSALNQSFGGRALFAGDAPDAAAFADDDAVIAAIGTAIGGSTDPAAIETAVAGIFDDPVTYAGTVYVGGTGSAPGVGVDTGETVDDAVSGLDEGIRGVLRETATVAALAGSQGDDDVLARQLSTAADRLTSEIARLEISNARAGQAEASLADAQTRLAAERTALAIAAAEATAVDPFAAAAAFNATESALSTLFAATGRLSQLTLANFL
ncbi:MAG: hypothetical protein AAF677_12525 [Pseudomonadota bacterium]